MKRREFVALLGGATLAWPLAARAQQPAMPVIGFLGIAPASGWAGRVEALRAVLREFGYVEGRNVVIEFRWAEGPAQLTELAAGLAKHEVAMIIAGGNASAHAAKRAMSAIPILFSVADDPVRLGFVDSFNRPGGNMTGSSTISGALGAKRLELLRELVPKATAIALLKTRTIRPRTFCETSRRPRGPLGSACSCYTPAPWVKSRRPSRLSFDSEPTHFSSTPTYFSPASAINSLRSPPATACPRSMPGVNSPRPEA